MEPHDWLMAGDPSIRWQTMALRGEPDSGVTTERARGRRFLLAHRMFRSHRTGEVVDRRYTRFSYPPRWHYDLLRGLVHLADVDAPADPACAEAIQVVRDRRGADGRWPLRQRWPGKTFFELEQPGQPSRWNTLRALRVLRWWDDRHASAAMSAAPGTTAG